MTKSIRASVILTKNNKMLVLKSRYSSGEFYLLPGGKVEPGEFIQDAAIREVKEETNYEIKLEKLLYLQEWINKKREKDVLFMIFLGKIISGDETHLNDPCLKEGNIVSIEWRTVAELKQATFHPKDILPLLEKDMSNRFKGECRFLDAEKE